ncbi:hypothetical protein A3F28_01800 [Candidatus Uhrbacteria bacterium RIFCSPHIGHO2_12_FULL_57_11]|uniref:inorganic diphosphatase n=1 Tax=Candidatus Uhrbacteria bacterium RIFCSPHIGHO2_12_FULL_57_11 TaxID=1802398 RepID=A0A1F7UNQ0_9BACT|nr:MAG: hypothetical protein A3F28_01800 [Candidatus Uhrbacteria bacterium RIFCSPHIGHO2_12_FULL_57_11]
MEVFIENERGSLIKNLYNEKSLEFQKNVGVSRPYPYPYGFIIGTTSGDGDNLDCFILTDKPIAPGTTVEVEPIGMYEQVEDNEQDPKILAALPGELPVIDERLQSEFREFTAHVFDHIPDKKISVGRFFGKSEALELVRRSADV